MVTDREIDDKLMEYSLLRNDPSEEQLSTLKSEMEWVKNGGGILDGVLYDEKLQQLRFQRRYNSFFIKPEEYERLREMIARCHWTFAKTMPQCPHDYIVRGKCPLTDEEFLYFIDMQRCYGVPARWGNYIFPYLHIDGNKYWTMGDTYENTIIINRAKE